jgi:hypothetical protein
MIPFDSSSTTDLPKLYVLNKPQGNQWCGYLDEKRWRSDIDEYGALETASVEFHDAHPRLVKLTEADNPEAGDWIAYDTIPSVTMGPSCRFGAQRTSFREVFNTFQSGKHDSGPQI